MRTASLPQITTLPHLQFLLPTALVRQEHFWTCADTFKVIGSSPNAVRMQKVVSFYEKLPRGPAPEPEGKGLLGRYQKKYMGKNASARRTYTPASTLVQSLDIGGGSWLLKNRDI
jgi:hypothetical protein